MLRFLLVTLLLMIVSLPAALQPGDLVHDRSFVELKFNEDNSVDSLNRELYTILDEGKTVIIYYFTITFS